LCIHYAPNAGKKVVIFWTGWTAIVGWLTLVTIEGFFAAQFFSAAAVVGSAGGREITQWRTYVIFVAILTLGTLVNIFDNCLLGQWNKGALYWSIAGIAVISITILATADKNDADFVFTEFANKTGWSGGKAWILGLLQSALSLIGYDAALHMTEETPQPSHDAPRAIIYSIVVGGMHQIPVPY
jgi:amino acid transporter